MTAQRKLKTGTGPDTFDCVFILDLVNGSVEETLIGFHNLYHCENQVGKTYLITLSDEELLQHRTKMREIISHLHHRGYHNFTLTVTAPHGDPAIQYFQQ